MNKLIWIQEKTVPGVEGRWYRGELLTQCATRSKVLWLEKFHYDTKTIVACEGTSYVTNNRIKTRQE